LAFVVAIGASCAEVPKEAVELSYQVGQDMARLYESYDALIHTRFEELRATRVAYLDNVWTPKFVADWVQQGRLVDVAQHKVVWSLQTSAFVAPTPGREDSELLTTVNDWSGRAIAHIERKRRALLDPIDHDEAELRAKVHEAFDRVIQANAYVTAHLASVAHVQSAQDDALKALGLKDLRDAINKGLIEASDKAAQGLEAVKNADQTVEKVADKIGVKPTTSK
jgi:hypothetical protein